MYLFKLSQTTTFFITSYSIPQEQRWNIYQKKIQGSKTKTPIHKMNQTRESTCETQNSHKQQSCLYTPLTKSTIKDPLNPQTFETPQSEQIGERRNEIQELSINSIGRSRTWLLEFTWLYKSFMLLYISQSITRMHHQMGIKAIGKARNDIFSWNFKSYDYFGASLGFLRVPMLPSSYNNSVNPSNSETKKHRLNILLGQWTIYCSIFK